VKSQWLNVKFDLKCLFVKYFVIIYYYTRDRSWNRVKKGNRLCWKVIMFYFLYGIAKNKTTAVTLQPWRYLIPNKPFVRPSELTFGTTKGVKLRNVITHILANQKIESFLYWWRCTHAVFNITCLPAFVRHRTSFQAFCRYFNHGTIYVEKLYS